MKALALALLLTLALPVAAHAEDLTERTAVQLRDELRAGTLSAEAVTAAFLNRIAALDDAGPTLNAVIAVNPDALQIARDLDAYLEAHGPMGPLHGLPVLIKDNIGTGDAMPTTGGSLALAEHRAAADAPLVARLRAAGAVVLGKTNLSEWANFRDAGSTSGWSSAGGQTRNPHVLDRSPCGSSSGAGAAIAARLAPLAVGTETDGSIACPAGVNGIVGIKPTVGTISRTGLIPISNTQDTAGPMARTVADAALLLETLIGRDPADPGTIEFPGAVRGLLPDVPPVALRGVRIGVYRGYAGAGHAPRVEAVYQAAVRRLAELGAEIVDPLEWQADTAMGEAEYRVMLHEFKAGLDAYLAGAGIAEDRSSLARLISWNEANAERVLGLFGQSVFVEAAATNGLGDPAYLQALEDGPRRMQRELRAVLEANALDAIVSPANGPAWKIDWVAGDRFQVGSSSLAAMSGFPSVIVPAGTVMDLPIGLAFTGRPLDEARLIDIAHAFEQSTRALREPAFLPSIEMWERSPDRDR
jgi:amidase